jgi:hypothetical protein
MNWKKVLNRHNKPEIVKQYFPYLFDDYGFSIDYVFYQDKDFLDWMFQLPGDWNMLLLSSKFRIKFEQGGRYRYECEQISIAVGPLWDIPGIGYGPWVDLGVVIAYLNQGKYVWDYIEKGSQESQLEHISRGLRPYMDQICDLFQNDNYSKHEMRLTQLTYEQIEPPYPRRKK